MGIEARVFPLFTVAPLDWEPPDPAEVGCVLLTSAHAARQAGPAAGAFLDAPCYAVGESTSAAAGEAGFTNIRTGPSDGPALLDTAVADGIERALHLCGRDHILLEHPRMTLIRRIV